MDFAVFDIWWFSRVRAHDNCKSKVGNTCGLTAKHLRACIEYMVTSGTQDDWGRGDDSGSSLHELNDSQRPSSRSELGESSASNSANSSTPSTPGEISVVSIIWLFISGFQHGPHISVLLT